MQLPPQNSSQTSRLPHRLATALVCAVFPLIWVGGLVTSSDAGMAVPDWPNTYGYNLFLYPWQTWFFGPWDIFVEHGHRLFGAAVGMLTIALAWSLWRYDSRRWMIQLGFAVLALVVLQGVLGGMRVVLGKQLLALVHGCVGPLFFALSAALWQFTSQRFVAAQTTAAPRPADPSAARVYRLALITTVLAYLQIAFGAVVRHVPHMPDEVAPGGFRAAVILHLFLAAVLAVHIGLLVIRSWATTGNNRSAGLRGPSLLLVLALSLQVLLGAGTWVVNYGYPEWAQSIAFLPEYVVRTQSVTQILVTTAHVAVGSLILVTSLVVTLRSRLAAGSLGSNHVRATTVLTLGGLFLRGAAV